MRENFLKWFVFSAVLSLVPLLFLWFVNFGFENRDSSLGALISRGELMLITAILCASVIGDIIGHEGRGKSVLLLFGGVLTILMITSSYLFSMFAYPDLLSEEIRDGFVVKSSLAVYVSAIISCSVCIYKVS